jgi:hypothetical protein
MSLMRDLQCSPDRELTLAKRAEHTRGRRIKRWETKFLSALSKVPSVKHACRSAGIARRTAYDRRERDVEFARRWKEAIDASVDELESVAFKKAAEGDANLITFLLRCHRPEIYRDTQRHEVGLLGGIVFLPSKRAGDE